MVLQILTTDVSKVGSVTAPTSYFLRRQKKGAKGFVDQQRKFGFFSGTVDAQNQHLPVQFGRRKGQILQRSRSCYSIFSCTMLRTWFDAPCGVQNYVATPWPGHEGNHQCNTTQDVRVLPR
ncbi:hypothetical protein J3458_004591 [Metarhizium acridum]|uniref:uncharacterized protein n=1 Tax=Metarhizium acridum TaxID=92637 RepID=UPI001C6B92F1|nr:hypothetical protein J3458_004591 [Metarhizium acridum]